MSENNKKLQRREFLAGASLLLGSAGVSALTRNDILKRIAGEILPSANAADPQKVDFYIELCGRAGVPVLWLGTGAAFAQTGGSEYPNIGIQQVSDLRQVAGAGSTSLYMNNVNGGGSSVAALLGPHANNIAISQGFSAAGLGHTTLFGHREGEKGMGLTTPIVEFAERAKKNFAYQSLIVHGVNWMKNGVMNQTNGSQDLVDVGSANQFRNLFQAPALRLQPNEVQQVAEAVKALSATQASILNRRINNIDNVVKSQEKGAELLTRDYTQLLDVSGMSAGFKINQPTFAGNNWGDIGSALAYSCKAFEHGLIAASTITFNSGDWHGFQTPGTQSRQAQAGLHFASMFNATIAYLKATPHPFRTGESLWDRTLIQMSSEFTRGVSYMGRDNNDGGTTGFLLMGGQVRGGYYGGFELQPGAGARATGFDITTGQSVTSGMNRTGEIYNTVSSLCGNKSKVNGAGIMTCLVNS